MNNDLRRALIWWGTVLELGIVEHRPWEEPDTPIVHLFCDAAGDPARIAAVLHVDGRILSTDTAPPDSLMKHFRPREDSQIMGLELLSIALGLSTFADECRGVHACCKEMCFLV